MADKSGVYDINPLKRERPEVEEPESTVGEDIVHGAGRIAKGAAAFLPQGIKRAVEDPMAVIRAPADIAKKGYDVLTHPGSQTLDIITSPVRWGDNPPVSPDQIQPGTNQAAPKQDAMSYFTGPMAQYSEPDRAQMEQDIMSRYSGGIAGTQGVQMQEQAAREAYDVVRGKPGEMSPAAEATQGIERLQGEKEQKIRGEETAAGEKFKEIQGKTAGWAKEVDQIQQRYPALTHDEASEMLGGARKFFTNLARTLGGKIGREAVPSVEEQIRTMQGDRDKLFERDINVLATKEKATLEDLQVAMNRRTQMSDAAIRTADAGIDLVNAHKAQRLAPLEALKLKADLGVVTDMRERAVAQRNQAMTSLEDAAKAQVFQNEHNPNAVPVGVKDGVPQFIVGYTPEDAKKIAEMTPHFKAVQQSIQSLLDMVNKRTAANRGEMEATYDLVKAEATQAGFGGPALAKTFTGNFYDDSRAVSELAKSFEVYQNAFYLSRGHKPYLDKRLLNIITKPKTAPSASTYATSVTGG